MGKKALSGRENWQTESGPGGRAGIAEKDLYKVFKEAFKGTDYELSEHPKQLKHLYALSYLTRHYRKSIARMPKLWKLQKNEGGVSLLTFQSRIRVLEKFCLVK